MKETVFELVCYFFSLVFFVSFISKLFAFQSFQWSIREFNILKGPQNIRIAAIGMLCLEFALAVSLSLLQYVLISLWIVCFLMLFFISLFIRSLRSKQSISCHCFGHQDKFTNIHGAIARNVIFLLLALLGMAVNSSFKMNWGEQLHALFFLLISSMLFELFRSLRFMTKK